MSIRAVLYDDETQTIINQEIILGTTKNTFDAIVPPEATDNYAAGYSAGSRWVDVVAAKAYTCVGDGVWYEGSGTGGGHAILSNGVAVAVRSKLDLLGFGVADNAGNDSTEISISNSFNETFTAVSSTNFTWQADSLLVQHDRHATNPVVMVFADTGYLQPVPYKINSDCIIELDFSYIGGVAEVWGDWAIVVMGQGVTSGYAREGVAYDGTLLSTDANILNFTGGFIATYDSVTKTVSLSLPVVEFDSVITSVDTEILVWTGDILRVTHDLNIVRPLIIVANADGKSTPLMADHVDADNVDIDFSPVGGKAAVIGDWHLTIRGWAGGVNAGDMFKSVYDPTASGSVLLADDVAGTFGNSKYYGTDGAGVKGVHDLPTAGMSNPMTAEGDLIIGDTDGAPIALPIGDDGEVLSVVSGALAYVPASSGGVAIEEIWALTF